MKKTAEKAYEDGRKERIKEGRKEKVKKGGKKEEVNKWMRKCKKEGNESKTASRG